MNDNRKSIAIAKKDLSQKLISGWISTEGCDMYGDVVLAGGMDASYYDRDNIRTLTLFHDPSKPCGKCRDYTKKPGKGVWAKFQMGSKSTWAREALAMLEDDIIGSFSIEWDPATLNSSPPTRDEQEMYGPACKRVFREWVLTGVSLVPQPMNAEAGLAEKSLQRLMELVALGTVSRKTAKMIADVPERKVFTLTPSRPKLTLVPGLGVVVG